MEMLRKLFQRPFIRRWVLASREAGVCLGLGARDAIRPRLLLPSILLIFIATAIMIWIYYSAPVEIAGLSGIMGLCAVLGGGVTWAGGNMGSSINGFAFLQLAWLLILIGAASAIFYVLLFAFGTLCLVLLALPVTMLPRALRQVLLRYPAPFASLPDCMAFNGKHLAKQLGWILLILLFCFLLPVASWFVLLTIMAMLNLLLLYGAVIRALPETRAALLAVRWRWRPMLLIGLLLLVLALIPVLNLLAPALMCTTMAHLACRDNRYCFLGKEA
ncbi:hypothetical protein [Chitinilyticum aquatile]|uniref:hypothetical protein n=1 Tax=Chitinilyticum aquatile TaxID=362520 RepID=UPI0004129142|nr:hypothetical protein [Chitinilyticum aquatile]